MSSPIISVESLGKRYRIRHQQEGRSYVALRDVLTSKLRSPLGWLKNGHSASDTSEDFWALRDVSFEVTQGEVVGIIGRNGAGKSTLLKILSRITEPTEGRVTLRGRVASLLEVGTGFHPELTGRENILLNGAILGMSRSEILRKFDEIVAFAEVEKFLDTPVKRYSSGMYVRLAFAVAAHLEPEILIVDEVLAVGDTEFQKKCLGKMQDVAKGGRTVLFVSHNMATVLSLCGTGVFMEKGRVAFHGATRESVAMYAGAARTTFLATFEAAHERPSITSVRLDPFALARGDLVIEIGFESPFPLMPAIPGLVISSDTGVPVFGSNPRFHAEGFDKPSTDKSVLRFVSLGLPLASGSYRVSVWLGDWHVDYDQKLDVIQFDFRPEARDSVRPRPEIVGFLDWHGHWRTA